MNRATRPRCFSLRLSERSIEQEVFDAYLYALYFRGGRPPLGGFDSLIDFFRSWWTSRLSEATWLLSVAVEATCVGARWHREGKAALEQGQYVREARIGTGFWDGGEEGPSRPIHTGSTDNGVTAAAGQGEAGAANGGSPFQVHRQQGTIRSPGSGGGGGASQQPTTVGWDDEPRRQGGGRVRPNGESHDGGGWAAAAQHQQQVILPR